MDKAMNQNARSVRRRPTAQRKDREVALSIRPPGTTPRPGPSPQACW